MVRVSHLAIYNEEVRDLLAKGRRSLEVHETGDGSVVVRGLSQYVVRNVADIAHVLRVRSTGFGRQDANIVYRQHR